MKSCLRKSKEARLPAAEWAGLDRQEMRSERARCVNCGDQCKDFGFYSFIYPSNCLSTYVFVYISRKSIAYF